MARPPRITDDQILTAAHALFMEKGLDATTLEIAKRAGISEGTIFKRFKTKELLFSAAMTSDILKSSWLVTMDELLGQGDLLENLKRIASEMIVFFGDLIPKIQMMMARDGHVKERLMGNPNAPPIRVLQRLMSFMEREQELGRMRPCNPEMLGRMMMASTHHYAFMARCELNQWFELSHEEFVSQTIEHLFGALIVNTS